MAEIQKIYSIKLEGEKGVIDGMKQVNIAFDEAREKFRSLKAMQSKNLIVEPSELEKERKALADAEKELLKQEAALARVKAETIALKVAREAERNEATRTANTNKDVVKSYDDVTKSVSTLKTQQNQLTQAQIKVGEALHLASGDWRSQQKTLDDNVSSLNKVKGELATVQNSIKGFKNATTTLVDLGGTTKAATAIIKEMGGESTNAADGVKEFSKKIDELTKQEALLKAQASQLNIEIRAQAKEINASDGSMTKANQTLGMMRLMWRNLNDEEKGSEFGQELLSQINILDAALKQADAEIGNHFRKVGDYTNSVVLALKEAGLEDLIIAQVDKSKQKLTELNNEFGNLKTELQKINETGGGGFERLEKKLIENRTEAEKLRGEVNRIETALNGMGNVGTQVTNAMGNNFQSLKRHLTTLVLGYVGLQAVMGKIQSSITKGIDSAQELAGVETAFERLNNPTLLSNLREAVKGTVTDLELMKATVNADNFGIPIKNMATFLEFAKRRADDTGQSVDYLVNSIVTGIGRKSPLILDNLGISAIRLKKELGGVTTESASIGKVAQAVGRIIAEENAKAGKSVDTVKTKLDQNKASWENLSTELGKKLLPTLALTGATLLSLISLITSIPFPFWIASMVLLTAAYWQNIVALGAKTANLLIYIVTQGIGNTLIAIATTLEAIQTAGTWLLVGAKTALNAILILLGVSTVTLNTIWLLLNATFLATPIGWIIVGITAIGSSMLLLGEYTDKTTQKLKEQGAEYKILAAQKRVNLDLDTKAGKATSNTIARIDVLTATVKNNSISLDARKKALEDLIAINPEYLKGLTLENIATAEGVEILKAYKEQIFEVARAKAAQSLLQSKTASIIENEIKYSQLQAKIIANEGTSIKETMKDVAGYIGIGDGGLTKQFVDLEKQIIKDKEEVEQLLNIVADYSKKGFLDGTDDIEEDDTKKKKKKDVKDDRLQKIDAERNRFLAIQKQRRLKDEIDEETYLENILKINQSAIAQKLKIIKGASVEERRMIEELKVERIQNEIDTNDTIFDLRKKLMDEMLSAEQYKSQSEMESVTNNPNSTAVQKEQAEQDHYTTLLELQVTYNEQMDLLEKEYTQKSIENAEERTRALEKLNQELTRNTYELTHAMFEQNLEIIERAKNQAQNASEIVMQEKRLSLLRNEKITNRQREIEIDRIYIQNQLESIDLEIDARKKMILVYIQQYGLMALMNEEVQESLRLIAQLSADAEELMSSLENLGKQQINAPSTTNSIQLATDGILDSFNLDEDDYGSLIGYALSESFDIATQAMNSYFEAERRRIEESKKLAYERIDLEKQQRLAQAQSAGERDAIEKQADQKKKQAEKEAGERLKKSKKAEAKIAFAMELANIWASVMQLGPIAGPIMGGILSAIATVRFGMNMANISKAQFGLGGVFKKSFGNGGMLDGPSHSDNNGMPVVNPKTGEVQAYLEGSEGIINKRAMKDSSILTVTGTPGQIASKINTIGGGVDFLGGATMKRFANGGMYIGSQVQPPVFSSYYDQSNAFMKDAEYGQRLESIEGILHATNEALNREVNRKTVVSSREMTRSQDEYEKQSEIATL